MDQKCERLTTLAPLEKNELERRPEKKLNDVNSFNNQVSNIEKKIAYLKDKNNKSKKKYKNYKTLTTILKSFDTFVIIAKTSSTIALSLTGIGLIVLPVATATACGLSIGNKVVYEIIINKNNNYQKQYEKDELAIKSFDKLYRNSLQDYIFDKIEYE